MKKFLKWTFTIILVAFAFVAGSILGGDGLGLGKGLGLSKGNEGNTNNSSNANGENASTNKQDGQTAVPTVTVNENGSVSTEFNNSADHPEDEQQSAEENVSQNEDFEDNMVFIFVEENRISYGEVLCENVTDLEDKVRVQFNSMPDTLFFLVVDDNAILETRDDVVNLLMTLQDTLGISLILPDSEG